MTQRPDFLLLCVDDMNDWVGCLHGYPGVHTPNIDRLAARGTLFSNAHCPSPVCNPSRTAILTGLAPYRPGVYDNQHWWRPAHPDLVTLPMRFREAGYRVAGAGKIFHHTDGLNPPDQWHAYFDQVFDDPWDRGTLHHNVPAAPVPPRGEAPAGKARRRPSISAGMDRRSNAAGVRHGLLRGRTIERRQPQSAYRPRQRRAQLFPLHPANPRSADRRRSWRTRWCRPPASRSSARQACSRGGRGGSRPRACAPGQRCGRCRSRPAAPYRRLLRSWRTIAAATRAREPGFPGQIVPAGVAAVTKARRP